ncbi:NPCBM/NEW2 domain-containing protein [Deinococcus koreensis]|uniref:Glycosyl hydrolase family 98 putative carbohydrate-binding module domain-containing protein n=1 Tax=Deinococcus koreensis TaxID=2054903 RepID=A0A2K3UT05_9DEIO|nr:NPCBM/NEW2 domain-containing protein [Deinococcus koreensis]PNY79666.1 hypothetical protein CVO96_17020 [Deinococcus koreensis]
MHDVTQRQTIRPVSRPTGQYSRGALGLALAMGLVACNSAPGRLTPESAPAGGGPSAVLRTGFLSDQLDAATAAANGWGPAERDMSNGDEAVGDGEPLSLAGGKFVKGLGVHARSDLTFALDGRCARFKASVGVDDSVRAGGRFDGRGVSTVAFSVFAGSTRLFSSGVMSGKSRTQTVDVAIPAGATSLRLVVEDGSDGVRYDHADWADAKVWCSGTPAPQPAPAPIPAPPPPPAPVPQPTPPPSGPQTGSYVDSTGTIVVDGQRFFPFGFYGVNWRQPFAERLTGLRNIGGSGFNTMLAEDISTNEFGTLLDEANRLKVKMLVGFPSLSGNRGLESVPYLQQSIEQYRFKPAVLGWSLYDDSDDGRLSPDSLRQLNSAAKAKDPSHLTFSTLTGYYTARRAQKGQWLTASDTSGLQMYPIDPPGDYAYDYGGNPLTESYNVSRDYVVAAEQAGKAMIINSQTFRWERDGTRYPTRAELRNMVYGQLFAGAKGIVGFVYSQELFDQKELWNELVALKDDVLITLRGPILAGRLTRRATADRELNYAYWEYQGACYVGILNTSYSSAKQVDLTLPPQCEGALSAPVSRLPSTMQKTSSTLRGTVAPTDVQVYRVGGT